MTNERSASPSLFLIAGPNGAGKTTYAFRHIRSVSGSAHFVNLDEIARGLSPLDPPAGAQRAARVAIDLTRTLVASKTSFSMETTLSGRTHLRTLEEARKEGFRTVLLYFAVADPAICLTRIARRVAEGGHDVPEPDVRRRFVRSLQNLPAYAEHCDLWRVFDANSAPIKVVAEGGPGRRSFLEEDDGLPDALRAWLASLPPDEG
ncbi:MAG TPA: AAA family ATPase [Beijerinckiaceae bacterium]|nr:AAA family ATPase [Beijerinckiaceae bacterium]HVB89147.1 AAA family ATPase [Beijerinckiaceae bacterium]